jgi:hypothetical protein
MNYATLTSDLQTYMLRTDEPYVAKIPDIIEQGIIRIYNNAKDIGFEITEYFNKNYVLTEGTYTIKKPSNWRETVSLSLVTPTSDLIYLLPRTLEYCRTYQPNLNAKGIPKYYYDRLDYQIWFISPSANINYGVIVVYLGVPLFDNINNTNFLTQRYPNLLLYSCLMEASLFLNNEEARNKYEMMFGKELETINRMNVDRTTDRTIVRDKS